MRGGKRVGAGRPKGSSALSTRELIERAIKGGELPIDYMLRVMRNENISSQRRDAMAKAAASYLYGKVRAVEVNAEDAEDMDANSEPSEVEIESQVVDGVE